MTTTEFRTISNHRDLAAAVADGFATIIGAEPVEGSPRLVDIRFSDGNFGGGIQSLMRASKTTARKLGAL